MAVDLNLRNLDPKFIAKLKSDAALAGVTLREWCIKKLGGNSMSVERRHSTNAMPEVPKQTSPDGNVSGLPPSNKHHPTCKCLMCKPAKTAS